MVKFAYNKAKNINTGCISFKLNYSYYSCVFYEKNIDLCLNSKISNELLTKLGKLMTVCQKNLYYTQKLQKQAYNKTIKSRNNTSSNKIWLYSKYIKIK